MIKLTHSDISSVIKDFLEDLKLLFKKNEIRAEEIDNILNQLKTEEVKDYLEALRRGTKPEDALKYAFFRRNSIFEQIFEKLTPEVSLGEGWVDYVIEGRGGRPILLELKSLFTAEFGKKDGKKYLKRLKQEKLTWTNYKDQIIKYVLGSRRDGIEAKEFIILSNLKEWFLFSRNMNPSNCKPFYQTNIFLLFEELKVQDLWDYLLRKESEAVKFELDKQFFESLKTWVKKLSEVEFTIDDKRKMELIIGLINKFIFIQTLNDYGVIDNGWIQNTWFENERKWAPKGKLKVLEKFFKDIDEFFYTYYDTELFKWNILDYIKKENRNIEQFYRNLMLVLGIAFWQTSLGGFRGIMQYKFTYIDEDVFGKAYEMFLAEIRKEKGIYYTPKYITEYIVENTIGRMMDELVVKIKDALRRNDYKAAENIIRKLISIKVLDPACGSGSFLIKALRAIYKRYKEIEKALEEKASTKTDKITAFILNEPLRLKSLLGFGNNREVISKILVRHIHGNDLDRRAIEVAKVTYGLKLLSYHQPISDMTDYQKKPAIYYQAWKRILDTGIL